MTRKNDWIEITAGELIMEAVQLLLKVLKTILLELLVKVVNGGLQEYSLVEFQEKTAAGSTEGLIEVLVKRKNVWIGITVGELIMEVGELLLEVGKAILLDLLVKVENGNLQEYALVEFEKITAAGSTVW